MIKVVPYSPELKQAFYDINVEWIGNMFVVEDFDAKVLKNPEHSILDPGGQIFFAIDDQLGPVGTCALRKSGPDEYELTKMGVLEKARGKKIGETLLQFVIEYVKKNEIPYCYLLTNKNCEAAIHLYEKNGFVHDQEVYQRFAKLYQRCNVAMRLR